MRMIDADIADVVIICDKSNELTQVSAIREYIKRQKAFLDKFPTIDAVPVTRCKDCKYWQDNNDGYPHEECRWGHGETPDANDFCSYGERKGGAD